MSDLKPYEKRERVVEFFPASSVEALEDGDYRIEFLCHGLTACGTRYYPKETLQRAAEGKVFDGAKMYLNHRDPAADKLRGHRDLRDWAATIREGTVTYADGNLQAICHAHTPEVTAILNDPVAKAAVGLSHDSFVRVKEARIDGVKRRVVEAIEQCNSVDFVPSGNAYGRVLEAAHNEEVPEMALEELTLEALIEGRPDLVAQIQEAAKPQGEPQETERLAEVEKRLAAATEQLAAMREEKDRAAVMAIVTEAVGAAEGLSAASRSRVIESFRGQIVAPDELPARIEEACQAERGYALELLKEAGVKTRVEAGASEGEPETQRTQETYQESYAKWLKRQGINDQTAQQLLAVTETKEA